MEQVTAATGGKAQARPEDNSIKSLVFEGVATDSRKMARNSLFVPLKGQNYDGHDFIESAMKAGAKGFLYEEKVLNRQLALNIVEKFSAVGFPVNDTLYALGELARSGRERFRDIPLAAITGSVGKSTTKEMAASILSVKGTVLKNEGNLNNRVGLPLTLFGLSEETDMAVVELGANEPGEIARLAEIAAPNVGCVANVGPSHIEGLGDVDGVAREKGALPDALGEDDIFVANLDDERVAEMAERTRARVMGFGLKMRPDGSGALPSGSENYVTARNIRAGWDILSLELVVADGETVPVELPLPGRHNALNALAAAAITLAMGSSLDDISKGLRLLKPLKWRTELKKLPGNVAVIEDCYNSNPMSARAALELLSFHAESQSLRSIAVLGEMLELGDAAEKEHEEIGREAARRSVSTLIALGEHSDCVIRGFNEENPGGVAIKADSVGEAAGIVNENLAPGTVALLKASRGLHLEDAFPIIQEHWESRGEGA